jgi:hypothetical protein
LIGCDVGVLVGVFVVGGSGGVVVAVVREL